MSIDEIEEVLTTPNSITSQLQDDALLRIWDDYNFIQYPRAELKQVIKELKSRMIAIQCGVERPTASDRLLVTLLKSFACDVNNH